MNISPDGWQQTRPSELDHVGRHCEEPTGPAFVRPDDELRDEAIQPFFVALDCFASLAMT